MTASRTALSEAVAELPPLGLDAVLSVAGLQTRTDHKYLLAPGQFRALLDRLGGDFFVLEMEGRRLFDYESVYFDTPDLALFRAHRQGRRRRYKVRTRTYLNSQETMFEVKLKGLRGETVKRRTPHPLQERHRMTDVAHQFLTEVLGNEYGTTPPELAQAMVTTYARATLVNANDGSRLTCDVGLVCTEGDTHRAGPDLVLMESKSVDGDAVADRELASMGVRMLSLSKYCIGTALLHPHLPANPWSRLLRQQFGWERELPSAWADAGPGSRGPSGRRPYRARLKWHPKY